MSDPHGPPGSWVLTFEDTFPGTVLNTTYWIIGTGTVNNVLCFASNVIVNNGLSLQLANSNSGAEIYTNDPYNLPVGSVAEAMIYFPGSGGGSTDVIYNWPAWWVSGPNWPYAGEIDIAEGLGNLTVNYHGPGSSSYNTGTVAGNWSNAWHTYTLRRNKTSFDVWYDGVLVRSNEPTGDNGVAQNMILNVGNANTPVYGSGSLVKVAYVRQWAPAGPAQLPLPVRLLIPPNLPPVLPGAVTRPFSSPLGTVSASITTTTLNVTAAFPAPVISTATNASITTVSLPVTAAFPAPAVSGLTIFVYMAPYTVYYMAYVNPPGMFSGFPGETVTSFTGASNLNVPAPPTDGRWSVNGVFIPRGMTAPERIPRSGWSVHDELCPQCLTRHRDECSLNDTEM
jgi:hypothetical protein